MSYSYSCCFSVIRGKSLIPSQPQALGINIHPSLGGCENQKGEQMGKPSEKQVQYLVWKPEVLLEEQDCNSPGKSHLPWSNRLPVFPHSCFGLHGRLLPQPHSVGLGPSSQGFIWRVAYSPELPRALATRSSSQEGECQRRYFSVGYPPMLLGVGVETGELQILKRPSLRAGSPWERDRKLTFPESPQCFIYLLYRTTKIYHLFS